jgi:hypothetical protein
MIRLREAKRYGSQTEQGLIYTGVQGFLFPLMTPTLSIRSPTYDTGRMETCDPSPRDRIYMFKQIKHSTFFLSQFPRAMYSKEKLEQVPNHSISFNHIHMPGEASLQPYKRNKNLAKTQSHSVLVVK